MLNKEEKVQIILQYLETQGWTRAHRQLEIESQMSKQPPHVDRLRESLSTKNFQDAELLLNKLVKEETKRKCMLLILEYFFVDMILNQEIAGAYELLRNHLQLYCEGEQQKHRYASYFIEPNLAPIPLASLLENIIRLCHHELGLLEPNRLQTLIQQSLAEQILSCEYHVHLPADASLFCGHVCNTQFSWQLGQQYKENISLFAIFDDTKVFVFDQKNVLIVQNERSRPLDISHDSPINSIQFSACGKYFGTTSDDKTAIVHRLTDKKSFRLRGHADIVTGLCWVAKQKNENHFVTISRDGWLYEWQNTERKGGLKVEEKLVRLFNQGNRLILVSSNKASIYDAYTKNLYCQTTSEETIRNADISEKYLLLNVSNEFPRLDLYNLDSLSYIKKFQGFKPNSLTSSCLLGWHNSMLVATASCDGILHIWHIQKGPEPIQSIKVCENNHEISSFRFHPQSQTLIVYTQLPNQPQLKNGHSSQQMPQPRQGQQSRPDPLPRAGSHGYSAIINLLTNIQRSSRQGVQQDESSDSDI